MVNVRVQNVNGAVLGVFLFTQVPRKEELVVIPGVGPFRVLDVQHAAGDPQDNNPPTWSLIIVRPGN